MSIFSLESKIAKPQHKYLVHLMANSRNGSHHRNKELCKLRGGPLEKDTDVEMRKQAHL